MNIVTKSLHTKSTKKIRERRTARNMVKNRDQTMKMTKQKSLQSFLFSTKRKQRRNSTKKILKLRFHVRLSMKSTMTGS